MLTKEKHKFSKDIKKSRDPKIDRILNELYYKSFPTLDKIITIEDKKIQSRGIDKILVFKNGKSISIDEKIRFTYYPDIFLEEYSNWEVKSPGWLSDKKYTDYIVYYKQPKKETFFFPFFFLQQVWKRKYQEWLNYYGRKFSPNEGEDWREDYESSGICVPANIIYYEITKEMFKITPE